MEESPSSTVWDGNITGIRFGLASRQEICTASSSDFPISAASQLANPFLGLPLESGKCESCGAAEPGKCEGHFGFIELPIPIYHPSHVSELKRLLSLVCLKCLKLKNRKNQVKNIGILERTFSSCCEEGALISINEVKTTDGAFYLELRVSSRSYRDGFWNFLEKYGYRYGDEPRRPLLPSEVMVILKKIPEGTKKKLAGKGYFPQDGYIVQCVPVPPNCLSVPDVSDGITVMSSDHSIAVLKKVLKQVEIIKSSRSGTPNFESHEVEANDLQAALAQYIEVRGTAKASRDVETRFGVSKELNHSSTKAWLEKMKTLFIRKGSGFSSRSVITGDAYKGVHEIGLPFEIAQRITFEERVTEHNMQYLQKLVDEKLCLTYRDGSSTYSLREGSKGHTFLRPGQVVHRRIMDGDIVFINRPPTTHKHSLQALSVYVHDDHTVKINPLICGPLSADFDGDCIHLFYPQSLAAKAEVFELFSVEKQLLSSHSGNLNLQLANDSLLSLKILFKNYFLTREAAQQLAMFVSNSLPQPALFKANRSGPQWTALQLLQIALPQYFDCCGDRHLIRKSDILRIDYNRDVMQSIINDIVASIFFEKGPDEVLKFFNHLQPFLMENLFLEGSSVGLEDFYIPNAVVENIQNRIEEISPLLYQLRSTNNEVIQLQIENHLRLLKMPVANFILKSSAIGDIIDSKSDSSITKVVQQVGFLGLQLQSKGKFYSRALVADMASLFHKKYPFCGSYTSEEFGLVRSSLFHGLDAYQEMVHSISAREVIVRSSRGLTEPGTLFKNLMAILRDVVICYDGTVRNVCSNSIIQFEYGVKPGTTSFFAAGEPVGVLAATAMSNPAYKAVLDSSPSSNSSWEMMKEILLCSVNFRNDLSDRRVILYLNDCDCGRKYCRENAAYLVKNQLKKVSLKDIAVEFLVEYNGQQTIPGSSEFDANLLGHIHLNKLLFQDLDINMQEIGEKCQGTIDAFRKKKKIATHFKRIKLSSSEGCSFGQNCDTDMPCLKFFWEDTGDLHLERTSQILADIICPVLTETIIKGDPRVCMANIIWISPDTTTWIRNPCKNQRGELALDVVLEKESVKQSGDAWRIVLDSCLPVIHLIDTSRSIPHAIKQVQELLGISCAFEQAVQRLSTSVSMVAKGVLKEHLILLANSMTCAGNLIGFNTGGIKALSRSLNVQVPFTEATLFTPKKCFERAAEKCHVDSLSSIVASCSWGKQVAVGTGSRFDVFWDTREVGMNQQDGIDVYNFLHLVRSSSKEEETNSACLGAEIDYFDLEGDDAEWALSPERSSDKPTFEDSSDFQYDLENEMVDAGRPSKPNWEKISSLNTEPGDSEWVVDKRKDCGSGPTMLKPSGWSSWGADTVQAEDKRAQDVEQGTEPETSAAWGSPNIEKSKVEVQSQTRHQKETPGNFWSSSQNNKSTDGKEWAVDKNQNAGDKTLGSEPNGWSSWGASHSSNKEDQSKEELPSQTGWQKKLPVNSWKSNQNDDSRGGKEWDMGKKQVGSEKTMSKSSGRSSWGANTVQTDDLPSTMGQETELSAQSKSSLEWGSFNTDDQSPAGKPKELPFKSWTSSQNDVSSDGRDWLASKKQNVGADTTLSKPSGWSGWGTSPVQPEDNSATQNPNDSSFKSWSSSQNDESSKDRDCVTGQEQNVGTGTTVLKPSGWSSWVANTTQAEDNNATGKSKDSSFNFLSSSQNDEPGDGRDWLAGKKQNFGAGTNLPKSSGWSGWGGDKAQAEDNPSVRSQMAEKETQSKTSHAWGSRGEGLTTVELQSQAGEQKESPGVKSWSLGQNGTNEQSNQSESKNGWDSPSVGGQSESGQFQWGGSRRFPGKREQTGSSRGRGSANSGEWRNKAIGNLTATRQRLDMFTSEEQDILLDVEAIMQSIRRIMHQTGYNDGDALSADDHSYVLDNVFTHHPDKAAKMGAGIDYFMVSKHTSFQDSRCFYVVSTDGHKEDFSYRKCLENFIKGKYPDKAESFNGKYFKKPQPRPNQNRERSLAPPEEAAGTGAGAENISSSPM
ncbi:DNA-directed RNA polymerase V subunit 1-like [Actinidia eriantha]|uniref:DNA-directed RNA polymerase V subunit 1-like n=1 Tax=Actinidia eriantha TaxID=165200 RepID=UPI00258D24A0|nr:DNA-directed RNA polymerase V subunit 1-like [Actinidia eriantha]